MSDLFEHQPTRIFRPQLPESPEAYNPGNPGGRIAPAVSLPEKPEDFTFRTQGRDWDALTQGWEADLQRRKEFRERLQRGPGSGLSLQDFGLLYDWREKGLVDDDDIYKVIASKNLGEYLGLPPMLVYDCYDELWGEVVEWRQEHHATPQSRAEAVSNSIAMAKNMEPLGRLGMELRNLHMQLRNTSGIRMDKVEEFLKMNPASRSEEFHYNRAWENLTPAEQRRVTAMRQAEALWNEITAIQEKNAKLGRGMPTDPLTFILTSTIQSAPLTGKAVAGGVAGAAVLGVGGAVVGGGLPGFMGGARAGYRLGSFAASSTDMIGMMYVDLLAAGVEQHNAIRLAALGGSIQGLIESELGTVGGWGKSLLKTVAGRALSKAAQKKIAAAASKNFIQKITTSGLAHTIGRNMAVTTVLEAGKQAAEEGLEEVLQALVDQAMLSLADAMQSSPVDRNNWGDKAFWAEMKNSFLGGIAGGIGFGIAGLPLTHAGNVSSLARQTSQLQDLAVTIADKAKYRELARQIPAAKNLSDEQLDQMHASQESGRREYHREETARAEELKNRRLYGALDQSGDVYRGEESALYMEVSRHRESGGLETFQFAAGDPHKSEKNSYAIGEAELRGGSLAVTEFRIGEKYEGLRDEILQEFANDIGKPVNFEGSAITPNGAGRTVRFGFEAANPAVKAYPSKAKPQGKTRFNVNRPHYSTPDTQADTQAKQQFSQKVMSLDTHITSEAQARTVTDFYDTIGRKWFGMGFDAFMNRITGYNQDNLFTQELTDDEVARWVANKEGVVSDAAAVQRIHDNLTDVQRKEARERIRGFAVPGADGITKAIYAAKDADVSTFIHEGVHAFTQLARALDNELYSQMMKAAGFDQQAYNGAHSADRERMTREAMETLAYGAEAYLREGPKSVNNPALLDLYGRIKEFLKDLVDAARKSEYLTPEVRVLFDDLFGEQTAEGARLVPDGQIAAQTGNNTAAGAEAATERQGAIAEPAGELEIYSDSFDETIKDKNRSIAERSEAAVRKAERESGDMLLDERYRGHRPTAELIKRAKRIPDAAEKARVVAEIQELRKRYAGTKAEYMAPNGRESLLLQSLGELKGKEAWYAARTEGFKQWFGDWERAARIAAVENLEAKKITTSETKNKKEVESLAFVFEQKQITNNSDGRIAVVAKNTIGKILNHKEYDISQIIEHIPSLYETSLLGWSESEIPKEGHKPKPNIKGYHHYVNKFADGTGEYFIRFTLHEEKAKPGKKGKSYIHSTAISDIAIYKKGDHSQRIRDTYPGEANPSPFYDSRLADFFDSVKSDSVSKIVDENGEPKALWHQTGADIEIFEPRRQGAGQFDNETPFGIFLKPHGQDIGLAGKKQMALFADINNPLHMADRDGLGHYLEANVEGYKELRQDYENIDETYQSRLDALEKKEDELFEVWEREHPEAGIDTSSGMDARQSALDKINEDIGFKSFFDEWHVAGNELSAQMKELVDTHFRNSGFDGVILEEDKGGFGKKTTQTIIAFDSSQIKSATENAGTFENDNIYFQAAYHGSPYTSALNRAGEYEHGWGHSFYSQAESAEWVKNALEKLSPIEAHLHVADIPEDQKLLHWDKTIAEQPKTVRDALDKIITWDGSGKSEFNRAYNVRKFNDGSYGFYRSIDGKMKWGTIEAAQAAARGEIKKTLTGEQLYKIIANKIGKKDTSLLLFHMGIKGTKYFDNSTGKIGVTKGHNYVVYDDSAVQLIPQIAAPPDDNIYFQAAFHGSPYRFEHHDNRRIGKGYGKQSFGYGHYFATKKEVAEWYGKKRIKDIESYRVDGKDVKPGEDWLLYEYAANGKIDELVKLYEASLQYAQQKNNKSEIKFAEQALKRINDLKGKKVEHEKGHLYEADIPGDEELLDWNKSYEEQPPLVQDALKAVNAGTDNATGEDLYRAISKNPRKASMWLLENGVKGIRFFDDISSEAAGGGSYNYVIFDDNDIAITQTFFSESFRDHEFEEFIASYPEVVKEASRFDSGAELAEHYADYLAMPDEVYKKAHALGYFDALARAAKAGDASGATNMVTGVSAQKAAEALAAYGVNATHSLEAATLVRQDNWQAAVKLLEQQGVPRIDAETYADTAKSFSKSEMQWLERTAKATENAASDTQAPVRLGKDNAAVRKFFDTLVDSAKEIYPDTGIERSIEQFHADIAGTGRTAQDLIDFINTENGFDEFLRGVWATVQEGPQRGDTDAQTKRNEAMFNMVRTAFNPEGNGNWKAAFSDIAAGRRVNDHNKKIIRGMIRNRPLQYMDAWARITGDDTWLPRENDIQRIKRLDTEGLADEDYMETLRPEELQKYGRQLSSDRVKAKIDSKTLLLDDPDLNEYETQLKADMARFRELITEREEGLKEHQGYLEMAERNARKEQLLLERMASDTSAEGLKASRVKTKEVAKAQQEVRNVIDRMDRFMRNDLSHTQRAAFLELRSQLRERERIQAELGAIAKIREIKVKNLRQILRKADLKTVSVTEAKYIDWIQSHFDSYEAVAKFVGRGAKDIRLLYNEFATKPEYRENLKKKLPPMSYHQITTIVFKDMAKKDVRAYGEIDARQRRILYKHLTDYQGIFEEMGIDITAEPPSFSKAEYSAIRAEMHDRIPADLLCKLEGLLEKDANHNKRFRVERFTIEDLQTLAGAVNRLRTEGREREAARQQARRQMRLEAREKIQKTLEAHMPKNAAGSRMKGIASTNLAEEKRSKHRWVWLALHNARRFFRMLEGGVDDYLHDFITQREYDAFDTENGHIFERRENVETALENIHVSVKDLVRNKFTLYNGQEATLDEMLTFYYAQYNERALHAVTFGNFASPDERKRMLGMADNRDIDGGMQLEAEIARRYWSDMQKLNEFFAQEGNGKYRQVMEIIGRDYEDNYGRLKDFVAREYNEEMGSEKYYMPLNRLGPVAQESEKVEQALVDNGLSHYINKGFTKGRVDIPSYAQQEIQAGFYATWDRMVVKQEHLMAYDPLMRELNQIFLGTGSEDLRDTLVRGHSQEALKYVERFISELGSPPVQEDFAAMDAMNRLVRGHYSAAVLGWRVASIVKQAIESPPPFFQYVSPAEYAKAAASCLNKETRDMIRLKSVYVKARYFDPAAEVVREMEKLYLAGKLGKAEAVLAKAESLGMTGQEWIDAVCVMPGWLAAYNRKKAELNRESQDMSLAAAEDEAVRFADLVVRDCQPSSVQMDQTQLLKNFKHPLAKMFAQFQTPTASIFQQLFIDAPIQFRQGHVLNGLWKWGIYALLAITIGAMHDDGDDDDDGFALNKKLDIRRRWVDAAVMPLEMIPVIGGTFSYAAESFIREGKIRMPRRSNFPVIDSVVRAANAITDEKWGKAALYATDALFYQTGLPAAAKNDIEKAIETGKWYRLFGIW
jgi:hypothetical protein